MNTNQWTKQKLGNFFQPIRSQDLTVKPNIEKVPKMRFEKIKVDKPVPLSHVIKEGKQQGKSDIIRVRTVTHNYNTRSRVNHVTTFNNTPQLLKNDMTNRSTTHVVLDYIAHTYTKKDTIKVEPVAHHLT